MEDRIWTRRGNGASLMDIYNNLYEAVIREKDSTSLSELDPQLIKIATKEYSKDSIDKNYIREKANVDKLIKDLISIRVKKIFNVALLNITKQTKQKIENGTKEEECLYKEIFDLMDEYTKFVSN